MGGLREWEVGEGCLFSLLSKDPASIGNPTASGLFICCWIPSLSESLGLGSRVKSGRARGRVMRMKGSRRRSRAMKELGSGGAGRDGREEGVRSLKKIERRLEEMEGKRM